MATSTGATTKVVRLRVLELYSGIGGMHWALQESGIPFEIVQAFDINTVANKIYQHNFPDVQICVTRIENLTLSQLNKWGIDAILMSPPCQPFTRVGKKLDCVDTRTKSFLHLLDLIRRMEPRPRYLLVENVKGFEVSETHQLLVQMLQDCSYSFQKFLLSPLQFGIPNSRMRYYLIAKQNPEMFVFPTSEKIMECIPEIAFSWLRYVKSPHTTCTSVSGKKLKHPDYQDQDTEIFPRPKQHLSRSLPDVLCKQSNKLHEDSELHEDCELHEDSGLHKNCELHEDSDLHKNCELHENIGLHVDNILHKIIEVPEDSKLYKHETNLELHFCHPAPDCKDSICAQALNILESNKDNTPSSQETTWNGDKMEHKYHHCDLKLEQKCHNGDVKLEITCHHSEMPAAVGCCVSEVRNENERGDNSEQHTFPFQNVIRNCKCVSACLGCDDCSLSDYTLQTNSNRSFTEMSLDVHQDKNSDAQILINAGRIMRQCEEDDPLCCQDGTCLQEFLESQPDTYFEPFLLSDKDLRMFIIMDVVLPVFRKTICFTRRYGHYVEGAGSLLQMTRDVKAIQEASEFKSKAVMLKNRQEWGEEELSILRKLRLRYFTPREVANLLCFPSIFSFPSDVSTIQRYRVLGNSLNVHVVSVLIRLMLLSPTT